MTHFQIAIDGPAASGKSTVARLVAERLGGYYINTGDMYRTVTWLALEADIDPETAPEAVVDLLGPIELEYIIADNGRPQLTLNGKPVQQEPIRAPEVAAQVSHVAKIPAVREWLIDRQRQTRNLGIVIMEGRDIGTVIFPEAQFKYFVTASPEVRARRRLGQDGETPADATVETVAAEIARRDLIDSTRAVAPLKPADDARTINTDPMSAEEVADLIVEQIRQVISE